MSSLTPDVIERAREIMRQNDLAERRRHQDEEHARYRAREAAEEERDRALAASLGITYEQQQAVEEYVRKKMEDER